MIIDDLVGDLWRWFCFSEMRQIIDPYYDGDYGNDDEDDFKDDHFYHWFCYSALQWKGLRRIGSKPVKLLQLYDEDDDCSGDDDDDDSDFDDDDGVDVDDGYDWFREKPVQLLHLYDYDGDWLDPAAC